MTFSPHPLTTLNDEELQAKIYGLNKPEMLKCLNEAMYREMEKAQHRALVYVAQKYGLLKNDTQKNAID
ncbi:MAG: hypothetical protein E7I62_15490 [Bilophila wadsworthia]|uniref:hypothetical protein n=1 Tax=Bilophila wadsworthia TaxID=35833 RepID=UPI00290D77F2|nr:hypothetical protein [Bilophila wadsworthia]MDU4376997.1 hypothetical protein [Bilophila wadsworthia]